MNYLLSLDQGTSSTRARLYTSAGDIVRTSQYPITQYYPQSGWVEHDPEEIWQLSMQAIDDVCQSISIDSIVACGITNQRETTVVWNKNTGECLSRAIVWQDRRTQEHCNRLAEHKGLIQEKTGLLPEPYFSATKLQWILDSIDEARVLAAKGALAFGTMDSFLLWRLTKGRVHATDTTNASRTMLFNIHSLSWDREILELLDIPASVLPEILPSDAPFGVIDKEWLGREIPITGVVGDQQAALIGQACFHQGMVKATFGTGGFLLLHTGDKAIQSQYKLLTTIAYTIKGSTAYALEGSMYHAGTTIKWLRDTMKLIEHASDTETLAASLSSNEGVYLISSFSGLGAPHWLDTSGASIHGVSHTTHRAHFARATLEGVCYQTREMLECMRQDAHMQLDLLRVDGGMAVNTWFLQFLSDQCNLKVQRPKDIETTVRGAAMLAGLGVGLFESLDALASFWQGDRLLEPSRSREVVEQDYLGWKQALHSVKHNG